MMGERKLYYPITSYVDRLLYYNKIIIAVNRNNVTKKEKLCFKKKEKLYDNNKIYNVFSYF